MDLHVELLGEEMVLCLAGKTRSYFQWKHGISLDASVLSRRRVPRRIGGSDELYLYDHRRAIFVGHRHLMRHGHCIAEPGSFDALYCPAPAAPPHHRHR